MATKAELVALQRQFEIAIALRDEAVAECKAAQAMVQQLLDITRKYGTQVDKLMSIIEDNGLATFNRDGAGSTGPVLH